MAFQTKVVSITNNTTPGNTAIITIPCGNTIDVVALELSGGLLPSHIKKISGKINDRLFYEEYGAGNHKREDYQKTFVAPNRIVLDFTERNARNGATEQLMSALASALFQKLTFEIEIDPTAPTTMRLEASLTSRPPTQNAWAKWLTKTTHTIGNVGEHAIMLNSAMKGLVKRVSLEESTASMIDKVEIWSGQTVLHNIDRATMEALQKRNDKVPQAGIFMLDFVADGNMSGVLDTQDIRNAQGQPIPTPYYLKVFANASGSINAYWDMVKPFNA